MIDNVNQFECELKEKEVKLWEAPKISDIILVEEGTEISPKS